MKKYKTSIEIIEIADQNELLSLSPEIKLKNKVIELAKKSNNIPALKQCFGILSGLKK